METKPKILVSKCLGFDACRWNGVIIEEQFIKKLSDFVEFITVCPEVEIGLGVPRDRIRIIKKNGEYFLIQYKTEKDITKVMENFSKKFLKKIEKENIDGVILKDRSPSCGIKDVKIFSDKNVVVQKGSGFFAKDVVNTFTNIPVESEGRLNNLYLKENFLTKVFLISRFRNLKKEMKELVKFHSQNKYLFLSYNQKMLRELGTIVANLKKEDVEKVFKRYGETLLSGLKKNYRKNSYYNTLLHIFGYFKDSLKKEEKNFILKNIEDFKNDKVGLLTTLILLKSYVIRFDIDYLKEQTIFKPFPEELI
ncbi:MAG: Uncharacterized protein XD76_0017 [candidate division TA06 bacterium 32_111]|uniref:DUF1722 domain-containing protein n=2 Tax=Bacteria candidate phyla TaxID=1783234 RepID=A0A124G0Q2_UNCT6|nr:MAG: Uncharacterized protein XD76_0017 [candidate division TA06 bacterium 32_111]KUK88167.1 MAG: Uncharacterized protein XE03_0173 [candidate division TA06 bacterium 34_109]HAF07097.1 DUF1722 domain-containing protein [candidate division WOR-3 bacterium]HCP17156.1 DUF1722 domain-containing protein [candidate division WOR-3 bacterium]